MSRVGKKEIIIPDGVTVKVDGDSVSVSGPKGNLSMTHVASIDVVQSDGKITCTIKDATLKNANALWGLTRSLIQNMVEGVNTGFSKSLEVNGVGFKVALLGTKIVLNVGFSHPVEFQVPEGITATVEKNVIIISGADKQLVGQVAAEIRAIRKPEPYKGKGIKYSDEVIRRKVGKVIKSAA